MPVLIAETTDTKRKELEKKTSWEKVLSTNSNRIFFNKTTDEMRSTWPFGYSRLNSLEPR
jgi:hypothetical protein